MSLILNKFEEFQCIYQSIEQMKTFVTLELYWGIRGVITVHPEGDMNVWTSPLKLGIHQSQ